MFKNDVTYAIIVGLLDTVIYNTISMIYNMFVILCKIDIFNNKTAAAHNIYVNFTSRVYTILAIAMLFFFAYELIMLIINPDRDTKATTGLVKDTVISIILIAIGPLIFNYMAILQSHIVDENTVFTVVLGKSGAGTKSKSPGDELAMMLLMSFLHPVNMDYSSFVKDGNITNEECSSSGLPICQTFYERLVTWSNVKGGVGHVTQVSSAIKKEAIKEDDKGQVEWLILGDIIGGCAILWFMVGYIFDVAVRAIKLGVLEITSPIFFVMRIFPATKKNYDGWQKEIIKTYLELFMKMAILAFTIELATMVPDIIRALWESTGNTVSGFGRALAIFFVILGLFIFAKQIPDLFKKLVTSTFFEGVNFKPGLKSRPEAQKVVGAGMGATQGMLRESGKAVVNAIKDPSMDNLKNLAVNPIRGTVNGGKQGYKTDGLGFLGKDLAKNVKQHSDDLIGYKAPWTKQKDEKSRKERMAVNALNDNFQKIFDKATDKSWGEQAKKDAEVTRSELMKYLSSTKDTDWMDSFSTKYGNIALKNADGTARSQEKILGDLKAQVDNAKYEAQANRIKDTGTDKAVQQEIRNMLSNADFTKFMNSKAGSDFSSKDDGALYQTLVGVANGTKSIDSEGANFTKAVDELNKAIGKYNTSADIMNLQTEIYSGPTKSDSGGSK